MGDIMKFKILLLAIIFLVSFGYRSLGYSAQVIDINNPDPNLWNNIQKEINERERSRQILGYFTPGNEVVQFRAVAEPTEKVNHDELEWLETAEKERLLVSKRADIDSKDIYGILIEKTVYKGDEECTITFHFKTESWDKIHEVTGRLTKKAPCGGNREDSYFCSRGSGSYYEFCHNSQ